MTASRVRTTLLTTLGVLLIGGGAAAYMYREIKKAPDQKRQIQMDARLFPWGRVHITGVSLQSERATFAATCDPINGCRLTSPIQGPADAEAMQALLDNVAALPLAVEPFKGEDVRPHLAEYGLDPAPITFTASTADGKVHRLYVGGLDPTDRRRWVAGGDPLRMGRADDLFSWALDRDLFAFRANQVFQLDRHAISEILVERLDSAPRTLHLTAGDPLWTVESDGRKLTADPYVIDKFLLLLTRDLKADAFVTDHYTAEDAVKYGLDKPTFAITVHSAGGRVDKAFVGVGARPAGTGEPDEAGKAAPFVHIEGASSVAVTYNALLSDLSKGLPEFRDKRVTDFDLEAVRRIEILREGTPPLVLDGMGDSWQLISPESAPARVDRAKAIAMQFSKLRAVRVIDEEKSPAKLAELGLEPPELRVLLRADGGRMLADIRFGRPIDKDTVAVTAEGVTRIDAVKDASLRLLPMTPDEIIRR